ncbi:hypothetical protein LTR87_018024, partial [Friedmanniomyces endolithicus]
AVECWTQHLIGTSRPTRRWRLEHVHGPRQAADDVRNCGVYVAWVFGYGGDMLKRNFNGSGNITPQDVNFNSVFTFPKALQEDMLR